MADPAVVKIILTWLGDCTENHPLCGLERRPRLPFRVIDVRSRDDPFLYETHGEFDDYLALSYCWGKQKVPDMMTFGPKSKGRRGAPDPQPNIESHKTRIPIDSMPETLRDGVLLTRWLGFRYIWIDALCMVQGDDEEWQMQNPNMADVYTNAKIVIAADSAGSTLEGFLYRTPAIQDHHRQNKGQNLPGATIISESKKLHSSPLSWDEPLSKRAWALSESIFANRMVHFTPLGLVWECNEVRHFEDGFTHAFESDDEDSFRLFRNAQVAERASEAELYRKWDLVVEQFTRRLINSHPDERYKDSQKLVALARVASQFSRILKEVLGREDEYLAGLWRRNFVRSLLWSVEKGLKQPPQELWRRSVTPRAPTWSWAAIEGPVFMEAFLDFHPAFRIEEVSVIHSTTGNWFGQVVSGKLSVHGRVSRNLEIRVEDQADSSQNQLLLAAPRSKACCHFITDVPFMDADILQKFSCLYLGKALYRDSNDEATKLYHPIMLLRPLSTDGLVFERVGLSSLYMYNDKILDFLDMMTSESIIIY